MGHGIHRRCRRDMRRQGEGHARINDRGIGQQERGGKRELYALALVGNHRNRGYFGASAGGGRNHQKRFQGVFEHASAAVLGNVVTTLGHQDVDRLAGINGRTTPDSDDGVAFFLAVNTGNIAHHGGGGIRWHVIVDGGDFQPAFLAGGNHRFQQARGAHALVSDNHRPFGGHASQFIRNVFEGGLAGNHFYRAEELIVFVGHYALAVSMKLVATFR